MEQTTLLAIKNSHARLQTAATKGVKHTPRPFVVSRTIRTTVANVICLDLDTYQAVNIAVRVPGKYQNERALLKAARPIIEKDHRYKAAHIATYTTELTHFSMPGQQYIDTAEIITKETES